MFLWLIYPLTRRNAACWVPPWFLRRYLTKTQSNYNQFKITGLLKPPLEPRPDYTIYIPHVYSHIPLMRKAYGKGNENNDSWDIEGRVVLFWWAKFFCGVFYNPICIRPMTTLIFNMATDGGDLTSPYYFLSTSLIANTMEQFAKGYWMCTAYDTASQLYLAAGVNNWWGGVTYAHGSAWATMTTSINSWVSTNGYSSQVKIRAAADIEPDFGPASNAIAWVNGYNASYGSGLWLYNVGAASGCPWTGTPTANSPCNNSWVVNDVWYVSWGALPFYVIPEIYNTAEVNAWQWYRISLYSALYKGNKISFPGTLTQYQACQQMGGCSGIDNPPSQGWTQLFNSVGADSRTALTNIRWSTDIMWR